MLKVNTKESGTVALLSVQGKIVRGETEALRSAVLAQSDASAVILDLARVNTIDAGGLRVLLELRKHTEERGIEFRLMNVSTLVGRVLEITRLNTVFAVANQPDMSSIIPLPRSSSKRQLAFGHDPRGENEGERITSCIETISKEACSLHKGEQGLPYSEFNGSLQKTVSDRLPDALWLQEATLCRGFC